MSEEHKEVFKTNRCPFGCACGGNYHEPAFLQSDDQEEVSDQVNTATLKLVNEPSTTPEFSTPTQSDWEKEFDRMFPKHPDLFNDPSDTCLTSLYHEEQLVWSPDRRDVKDFIKQTLEDQAEEFRWKLHSQRQEDAKSLATSQQETLERLVGEISKLITPESYETPDACSGTLFAIENKLIALQETITPTKL